MLFQWWKIVMLTGVNLYLSVTHIKFLFRGVHSIAIVTKIEKEEFHDDGEYYEKHYIHLELPKFKGVSLGKKYPYPIDPNKYAVGDKIDIIQDKEFPTDIIIKQEENLKRNLLMVFVFTVILFLWPCVEIIFHKINSLINDAVHNNSW